MFFDGQIGSTILDYSYFLKFFVGPLLHALMMSLVRMELLHVLPLAVHLNFFYGQVGGHFGAFLFSKLFCGTAPSCFDNVLSEDGELLHVLPLAVNLNFFLTDK